MKTYDIKKLTKEEIELLCKRNTDEDHSITQRVQEVITSVRSEGDRALFKLTERFDKVSLSKLYLERSELEELASTIGETEKAALNVAYTNIRKFHEQQTREEAKVETTTGVTCWRESRPIARVGFYIPGGTAVLPSTFLMLGVPAQLAGCEEIVVCTPPQTGGRISTYIAYCALLLKIDRIYLAGGAQAIAAMAYGTETVPRVDKIFGPGNQYVTKAKTLIQSSTGTAIDMPAGPSEVLVIADATSRPDFLAADLLAQAEHGNDSQCILVCTSSEIIDKTIQSINTQLVILPRSGIAEKALENSYVVKVDSLDEAMYFSNTYAPEHLILQTDQWQQLVGKIKSAGSVFLGHLTPESAGDYASGTNHTLPTSGFARAFSGVSVDSFVKKITFQHITAEGIKNLGPTVEVLAELEGLQAHKNAVSIRLKD